MTRFDVTSFGEAMIRLSVPEGVRLEGADKLDMRGASAESNVCGNLARLGRRCGWVSSLPDNALGRFMANQLRQAGVDITAVSWAAQGRMGTYFIEFAVPPRPIQVIYDRANSCVTQMHPGQIDWAYLLDTRILHLTGITPPLSPSCKAIVTEAVRRAKERQVAICFDVNYRSKLWTPEIAAKTLLPLLQEVDLLLCSLRDAVQLFGCDGKAETAVDQLVEKCRPKQMVVTLGVDGVIGWDGGTVVRQAAAPVKIIDRIGAGDALAAGVLHGWLENDFAAGLRYGTVLAALALSQHGDLVITTAKEVESLALQSGGDVLR